MWSRPFLNFLESNAALILPVDLTIRRAPLITLADDPGSAVLAVTCAGMVDLSNVGRNSPRRTVALYKDPYTGIREIDLPSDASGILLTLSPQRRVEFSADGRQEAEADTHPILSGIQFIREIVSANILTIELRKKIDEKTEFSG